MTAPREEETHSPTTDPLANIATTKVTDPATNSSKASAPPSTKHETSAEYKATLEKYADQQPEGTAKAASTRKVKKSTKAQ